MTQMQQFELTAQLRTDIGKGASRRLRYTGQVPAILYGAGKEPINLTLPHNELLRHLEHEAFYSHVLTINVGNQPEKAVLKDLQRHPSRPIILHADFQRVSETEKLHMHVPLHFINEETCPGVKQGGGIVSHHMVEIEVRCLPKDLPEFIEVDLNTLNINEIFHVSDLVCPSGVELIATHDLPVVSVHLPRAARAEDVEAPTKVEAEPVAAPAKAAPSTDKDKK